MGLYGTCITDHGVDPRFIPLYPVETAIEDHFNVSNDGRCINVVALNIVTP